MCKTKSDTGKEEEDYIDLLPILDDLYIDSESFLKPINDVEVYYE